MKILCVYHNEESRLLNESPVDALLGHQVVVATYYRTAQKLIKRAFTRQDQFDMVITDCWLPENRRRPQLSPWGPLMVIGETEGMVDAVGIFLPDWTTEDGSNFSSEGFLLASKDHTTPSGGRDWARMYHSLEMGLRKFRESQST